MTGAAVAGETAAEVAVSEEISDLGKCIKRFALSAVRNVRFLSSPQKAGRFTARNAS